MRDRLILVVSLWLKDSNREGFEAFERQAAGIMARYDGRMERVIRLDSDPDGPGGQHPFEVHLVSFPDRSAWTAYQQDPDTRALALWRGEVIARTVIHTGRDQDPYQG